jgi:hypothetical protein
MPASTIYVIPGITTENVSREEIQTALLKYPDCVIVKGCTDALGPRTQELKIQTFTGSVYGFTHGSFTGYFNIERLDVDGVQHTCIYSLHRFNQQGYDMQFSLEQLQQAVRDTECIARGPGSDEKDSKEQIGGHKEVIVIDD